MLDLYFYDNTYIQLDSDDRGLLADIHEYFSFEIPNAKYNPKVKAKLWDGRIRLLNTMTQRIYLGLLPYIIEYCNERDIEYTLDDDLKNLQSDYTFNIDDYNFVYKPHDYQLDSVIHALKEKRVTFVSPTSSGKSFIIYMIIRFLLEKDKKILLTVPTISLVSQMVSEFKEYDPTFPIEDYVHEVYQGQAKNDDSKQVIISTWQSIYDLPKSYFHEYDAVLIDEAHGCSSESLKNILTNSKNADIRLGFTGTLQDTKCHSLVIEGLLGKAVPVIRTKTLMERGIISKLKINCAILKYSDEIRNANKKMTYQEEMKFVAGYTPRNKVIKNLINSINGNTLILTAYRDHLKSLAALFPDKEVYIVHGNVKKDEREKIRKLAETKSNIVIIATYAVFSTGINIKNIQYVMFATGSKSQIRVLQSIGRGLRKDGKENKVIILDLVDDFTYKKKKNYILRHFFKRIEIYEKEEFKYNLFNIKVK
jgi:superfamily II DNA or RNA helicase